MGKKKDLKEILSRASEIGLTPKQIIDQSIKIEELEKKYSKSFQELVNEFNNIQKKIEEHEKTPRDLDDEITNALSKRSDITQESSSDEKNFREYLAARETLSPLGFTIEDISKVKTFLFSIKSEQYNPDRVFQRLSEIGDLETRKKNLEEELDATNSDLRESKTFLAEVRKLHETGLSAEQLSGINEIVSQI